jgi:hypothetical protein
MHWLQEVLGLILAFKNGPTTPRERYTSRAAQLYKERLQKLVQEDQKFFPHDIVIEGLDVEPAKVEEVDFFSGIPN